MSGLEFVRVRKVSDGVLLWIDGVTPPGLHCHLCFRIIPGTTCQQIRALLHADDDAGRTLPPFTLWETPPVEKAQLDVFQNTFGKTRERLQLNLVRVWVSAARCEPLPALLAQGWKPTPLFKTQVEAFQTAKSVTITEHGVNAGVGAGVGEPSYVLIKPGPNVTANPEGLAFHLAKERLWGEPGDPGTATGASRLIENWLFHERQRLEHDEVPVYVAITIGKFERGLLRVTGRFLRMVKLALTDPQNRERLRELIKSMVKSTPEQKPEWKELLGYGAQQSTRLLEYLTAVDTARKAAVDRNTEGSK